MWGPRSVYWSRMGLGFFAKGARPWRARRERRPGDGWLTVGGGATLPALEGRGSEVRFSPLEQGQDHVMGRGQHFVERGECMEWVLVAGNMEGKLLEGQARMIHLFLVRRGQSAVPGDFLHLDFMSLRPPEAQDVLHQTHHLPPDCSLEIALQGTWQTPTRSPRRAPEHKHPAALPPAPLHLMGQLALCTSSPSPPP